MVLRLFSIVEEAVWSVSEEDEPARIKSKSSEAAEKVTSDSVLTDVDSDGCFN